MYFNSDHCDPRQTDGTEPCRSARLSFREALSRAAGQVDLAGFKEPMERAAMRELCYVISEVYIMDPAGKVKIAGEMLDAYVVQEVFAELRAEHLAWVWERFLEQEHGVKAKRAWFRTALYNAVFESQAYRMGL